MHFKKILIANRGEIACRIIKTCKRLGIETVAIYSPIDRTALFVEAADEAYCLGSNELSHSYLDSQKIIDIARNTDCQAIHPGYGFLSENTEFSALCKQNAIVFIGPSAHAIELMGCKKQAKILMAKNNIPVVPGFNIDTDDKKLLIEKANALGYPLLIKAASGGGGKGMKRVESEDELINAIQSAKRESIKSFSSDQLLIEKYLSAPRHIEVQIFSDNHSNTVHLFDRDCSIQRRHQKIIEEAPAIDIKKEVREAMYQTGIEAANAINYSGAGTIEFLLDGDDFYFMEMNTRLQVEHPVTELITGIDLVEWQLLIAKDHPLPLSQEKITARGHAIEVRLYAEDPDNNYLPQTGILSHCHWPLRNENLRIDTGVKVRDEISVHYDPMIAKIIAFAPARQSARLSLLNALMNTCLTGLTTNLSFLKNILNQESFIEGRLNTHYLEHNPITNITSIESAALYASLFIQLKNKTYASTPWTQLDSWQAHLNTSEHYEFEHKDSVIKHTLTQKKPHEFLSSVKRMENFHAYLKPNNELIIERNHTRQSIQVIMDKHLFHVITNTAQYTLKTHQENHQALDQTQGSLNAPMPGMIVSVHCKPNDKVVKNQLLMLIEAMKMEHPIKAPYNGKVEDVFFKEGTQVNESDCLLSLSPLEDQT